MYIKYIDHRAWVSIIAGYTPPMIEVTSSTSTEGETRERLFAPKPEQNWTMEEIALANFNAKAMGAISDHVDPHMFRLFSNQTVAKTAWDILQLHCEGSDSVKQTKLRNLMTKFENLRMGEHETIKEYSAKILDISNESFALGESISNARLVSKVLRSLPERFNIKIAVIEETNDVRTVSLDTILSILTTFELNLEVQATSKANSIALASALKVSNDMVQLSKDIEESNLEENECALITQKFNNMLNKKRMAKFPNSVPSSSSKFESFKKESVVKKPVFSENKKSVESVQCRACQGFGHFANECANTLKKRGISYSATLSDSEDEDLTSNVSIMSSSQLTLSDSDSEVVVEQYSVDTTDCTTDCSLYTCLNSKTDGESECVQEEEDCATYEELHNTFVELHTEWLKQTEQIKAFKKVNEKLTAENIRLKSESEVFKSESERLSKENVFQKDSIAKLEVMLTKRDIECEKLRTDLTKETETLTRLNKGKAKLDEVLNLGNQGRSGIGYGDKMFVKMGESTSNEEQFSQYKHVSTPMPKKYRKRRYVCHHCFSPGHIRPFCYKLKQELGLDKHGGHLSRQLSRQLCEQTGTQLPRQLKAGSETAWVRKNETCQVVLTSFKSSVEGSWYFDSGCSRHMTGIAEHLSNYEAFKGGKVNFGGGDQGKIIGKGTLNVLGLPNLHNVLHVEGLKANLISISQLCDDDLFVKFDKSTCEVFDKTNVCVLTGVRSSDNCYKVGNKVSCHSISMDETEIWHQKLGHASEKKISELIKFGAAKGLPNLDLKRLSVCGSCQKGKQVKSGHKKVNNYGTSKCLELIHTDLMGPIEVESLSRKKYCFVCVDDFSRYTWVIFLREKTNTIEEFKIWYKKIKNLYGLKAIRIRSDHGTEFENTQFSLFCDSKGITHEFSAPKTPQQNGVAERKNRTLQEMARVMLSSKNLSKKFWAEAVNTACHVGNRVFLRVGSTMTPYEILLGKKPTVKYFHVFGCICYILNDREYLSKFDSKSDKAIFLGYSTNSRAYRVYNLKTKSVMESINVVFDDASDLNVKTAENDVTGCTWEENLVDDESDPEKERKSAEQEHVKTVEQPVVPTTDAASDQTTADLESDSETDEGVLSRSQDVPARIQGNHPTSQVIGEVEEGIKTRGKRVNYRDLAGLVCMKSVYHQVSSCCFVANYEPKNVKEALLDENWINAMQEELIQFEKNDVWVLVPRPSHVNVIGTKWIFKNKSDEQENILRNRARLVAQGYTQIEGIDFDETFAPVARIESIRLLLSIACFLNITLHQMDVKSAFLNGNLNEEAYVEQPKGFEDPLKPNHVFKLKKALYGLKQAPRAWYGRLTEHLVQLGFKRGEVDKTLFIKKEKNDILIAQIYVDDIVFGSTSNSMLKMFIESMTSTFEMSMVGELKFFLGLQIVQSKEGISISQSKYAKNLVKKFGLENASHMRTPMGSSQKLCKDEEGKSVDHTLYRSMIGSLLYLTASRPDIMFSVCLCARYQADPKESHLTAVKRIIRYVSGTINLGLNFTRDTNTNLVGFSDSDWAGSMDDRKSTTGGCFYLGNNLVSWFSRKQNCVSLSTAESEYVAVGSCCTQLLWMNQMLKDYGLKSETLTVFCDNLSAKYIAKNPVQHSRTKHIDIRHHFIRDLVEQNIITLEHVGTTDQLADIFTKALDFERFTSLRKSLCLSG
jgi:hypothetical protein